MSSRLDQDDANAVTEGDTRSSNVTLATETADRIENDGTAGEDDAPEKPPCRGVDIVYRYLTLETPLPTPATSLLDDEDARRALPPGPDLAQYENPHTWAQPRKHVVTIISCLTTFLAAYTAGSYSPPAAAMAHDLDTSQLGILVGITTFCIGFAFSPMVLAPVSETYGRRPVLVASGLIFVVFQALCSVMPNLGSMLVARLIVGVGGATFSSILGGMIADVFPKADRNTPMALFSGFVLGGTGAGPLVGAIVMGRASNQTLAWKWMFWHQAIMSFILLLVMVFFLRESRASVLLSRKARALNKWYEELEEAGVCGVWASGVEPEAGEDAEQAQKSAAQGSIRNNSTVRLRWRVLEDEQRASLVTMMTTSLLRPFHLLFIEPVVTFFSLWCAFAWAVLFCTFGSIPLAFAQRRDFTMEQSGYFFGAMVVGSILATAVGILQDRLLQLPQWQPGSTSKSRFWALMRRRFPAAAPECRLYFTCITALFLPIGLFVFGFTVRPEAHWFFPAAGIALATWGIYSVYLATFNYFADIYLRYASSALAAQSFCRNILGGAFPLVTGALFRNLGEERAGALLGGIATALSVIPWALVFFGERIRAKSKFAISLHSH